MTVDFHDELFNGKTEGLRAYAVRGEAREGTTCFWRIATLRVMWRGVRVALALTYMLPKESALSILQRLRKRWPPEPRSQSAIFGRRVRSRQDDCLPA